MVTTQHYRRNGMVVSHVVGCAILACVVSLVATCQGSYKSAALTAEEQDVFAVVIRVQMEKWIRDGDKSEAEAKSKSDKQIAHRLNFKLFFVEIAGGDPPDDFLERFRDLPRTILKVSREEPQKGPHTPVDKSTRQPGIIFSADTIKWIGKDSAQVEGGYYCGGLCAAGITFFVERENGTWALKRSQLNWIS